MELQELINSLSLEVKTPELDLHREVTGGYASDLLSDVIGNAHKGNIWVTLQVHLNIVAVASLKELAGIILVNSRNPDADTLKKANAEKIPVLTSTLPTFELVGKLYALGLRCR
ncbi:MAG: serine kinase [Nitrospirae bacterium]|nr:serine kinase [Nitrospirota bacterium]